MGVRAYDYGDTAIEIPSHRDLLGCSLGVHVDEDDFDILGQLGQFRIGYPERIIGRGHEYAALKIEDGDPFAGLRFYQSYALPGIIGRIVRRPQNSGILIEVGHDFFLVPDVIARRQDVDTPIEKFVRNLRRYTKAGCGVLTIQDAEIDLIILLQVFQVLMNDGSTGLPDRITDKKYFHGKLGGGVGPREACGLTYLNLLHRWAS